MNEVHDDGNQRERQTEEQDGREEAHARLFTDGLWIEVGRAGTGRAHPRRVPS